VTEFQCYHCSITRKTKGQIRRHLLRHVTAGEFFLNTPSSPAHADIIVHHCSECSAAFKTLAYLKKHMRKHLAKTNKCLHCVKTFYSKSAMLVHLDTHSNLQKYQYTQCSDAFNTDVKLRVHIKRTHLKKKFQSITKTKNQIKTHSILHVEGMHNDFDCSQRTAYMKEHLVSRFKCLHCDQTFYFKSAMI
jgi:uncharacterized protein with ATP-grasp and redox domains